jgi:hypothetical protein
VFDSGGVSAPAALRWDLIEEQGIAQALRRAQVRPLTQQASAARTGALPVSPALSVVLPDGLRRGSTVEVSGAAGVMSVVLALLAAPSQQGAWSAAVGLPLLSADAVAGHGIDLARFALVPRPGPDWTTVVGALLDSLDLVAVRLPRPPARLGDADARRLAARARQRGSVLIPVAVGDGQVGWPTADVRLRADIPAGERSWAGIGPGHGRLQQRHVVLRARGRGSAARPREGALWLPDRCGTARAAATVTAVHAGATVPAPVASIAGGRR